MYGDDPDRMAVREDGAVSDDIAECPECYAETDWEWLYCPWCGAKLRPDEWDGEEWLGELR